jgi:Protein of unknown function (DUF3288)
MMVVMAEMKEQQHPQWRKDRLVMDGLLAGEPTDLHVAELARLTIRYRGFPGARDIQQDLAKLLQRWELTEATLFERTRAVHAGPPVYKVRGNKNEEDWS